MKADFPSMVEILELMQKLIAEHGEEKAMKALECVQGVGAALNKFDEEIGKLALSVLVDIIKRSGESAIQEIKK